MVFRKGDRLPNNLNFLYNHSQIEISNTFIYLGVVYTSGGSNFQTKKSLPGQASNAIFTLDKYLFSFTPLKPSRRLEFFDKLVSPILNYACEVWGFQKATAVEPVHLQFCKNVLGVQRTTQNDFVYRELGRTDNQSRLFIAIIKYWLKVIPSDEVKYVKQIYKMMLKDIETHPLKQNWARSVKHLLSKLGFLEVWVAQDVGNEHTFLDVTFKTRVKDIFMQGWHSRLETSTRARFYSTFAMFRYQNYLDVIDIEKIRISLIINWRTNDSKCAFTLQCVLISWCFRLRKWWHD